MTLAPDQLLDRLNAHFAALDITRVEVNLLQPADAYLDSVGEDLRRRIFLTTDNRGHHYCLRPEFTIPVCMDHVTSGTSGARYYYGGRVFRQRDNQADEFLQSGVEIIGKAPGNSDADCLTMAIEALGVCGVTDTEITLGDKSVFEAFLKVLDLPVSWQNRLARGFGDSAKLEIDLARIPEQGILPIVGMDESEGAEARSLQATTEQVLEKMHEANLPLSGGRTAQHIAERSNEKFYLTNVFIAREQRAALVDFLALETPAENARKAMADLLAKYNLQASIDLDTRLDHLEALAKSGARVTWKAGFGRRLDYYNGIVFEVTSSKDGQTLCGGGRYDGLLQLLGASAPTPAIGFSIWIERISGSAS